MANEKKSKNVSMISTIGLRESINQLMGVESKYIPVATVCKAYLEKLDEGQHEELIYAGFINELGKVATHTATRSVISSLNQRINEHKRDIETVASLYEMQSSAYNYVVPVIESAVVNYMTDKNASTRKETRGTLSLFSGIPSVDKILENLSYDEYEEKTGSKLYNLDLNESFEEEKTYTQAELDAKVNEAKEEGKRNAINEAAAQKKGGLATMESHIDMYGTIQRVLAKEKRHEAVKATCEEYMNALNSGKPEELLYESFISALSKWNYLNAVDTEMAAMKDRVSKYKQDIDLKKILEMMSQTGSYYIVPLIEGVVSDYVENKTMTNKTVLKQRLNAFEYDPFVRDILNIVMNDQSLEANVYLGESVENLNAYVHTENVFSPVKYIKENECVFNVKGVYYNKKGNTITKLAKPSIELLDESFKRLCNLVNHPAVSIDGDTISIYEGQSSAKITESSITVNGEQMTVAELQNVAAMSHMMNENKDGFYKAIELLNENYDNIAHLDFVKRVAMNESTDKSVDVFKIKDKIFVTTIDESMAKVTFYRNVNPIQCRNIINEHMMINVSPLFEDVLPNQKAILEGIEETRKKYEECISELEGHLHDFDDADPKDPDVEKAIKLVNDELEDVKKKYKQFQEDNDKFINGDKGDADNEQPDDIAKTYDAENKPTETETDMEQPLGSTGTDGLTDQGAAPVEDPNAVDDTLAGAEATPDNDIENAINNAQPFDSDFDVDNTGSGNSKADVQVLRISYDENVKTGKKENRGTAFVVIPSVNANGDIKDETKTITFYLDASKKPILNNEYMPLSIYNAIISAISQDPDTQSIEVESGSAGAASDLGQPAADVTSPVDNADVPATTDASVAGTVTDVTISATPAPADVPVPATQDVQSDITLPISGTGDNAKDSSINIDMALPGLDGGSTGNGGDADDDFNFPDPDSDATPGDNNKQSTDDQKAPSNDEENGFGPVDVGLAFDDIKPLDPNQFKEDMTDMGIKYDSDEGDTSGVCLHIEDLSGRNALFKYFRKMKNFTEEHFNNFFPELALKNAIKGKSGVPMMESVNIISVKGVNESVVYKNNKNGCVKLTLPYNHDFAKMFGYSTGSKTPAKIEVVTESYDETRELYQKLNSYAKCLGVKVDESVKSFLRKYKSDFDDVLSESSYTLSVPYNGFLAQKLATKGIMFAELDEKMNITLNEGEYAKAKKIFENFYGDETPVAVKDFFQFADESLNEEITITIHDDNSGKTIDINVDDLVAGKGSSSENNDTDFEEPFKDTTFNPEDSIAGLSDDSSDKEESSEEDSTEKSDGETDHKNKESEKDEEKEEKKEKKFTFKKRKSTDESVKSAPATPLNESTLNEGMAKPNVGDYVYVNGKIGYVLSKLPMSENFIVNVDCHTVEVAPSQMEFVTPRLDTVECPHKFDEATLKLLMEQMVHCGMFMNENQITPNDCFVKYSEYVNAEPDDNIRLVIEGQSTLASKKYVRVLEEINDFANVSDYVEGSLVVESEGSQGILNVYMNEKDYNKAMAPTDGVRCIHESKLFTVPAGRLTKK